MDANYLVVEEMVNISKLFEYTCSWLKTCLKVFKVTCCRLLYPSTLEAFACLEV
jgi:hypothetical protein